MANQPNIRFKGFTEEWVEKFFEELYTRCIEKNDLSFGADKIISVANMFYRSSVASSSDEYMRTYNIMRLGDIAYEGNKSANYAYGRWVENYIGDGIVSHVFEVLRPKSKYDLLFWKYAINNECIMRHILLRCTKKATMMTNIVVSDFLKQKIDVPSIEEQYKIGLFLQSIDSTITQREKELEKLKNIKRALLEKLFPQNGSKVPALRFKEFTEEWEETCIGNAFQERDERSANGELLSVTINSGIRRAKEMERTFVTGDLSHYKVVRVGDIAYNTMRMWQGACGVSDYTGIVSPAYTIATPQKGHCSAFYACLFKTNNLLHEFCINSQGLTSDTWNLKYHNFSNIKITVPIEREQQKIANIFLAVNNLLSLREKQLTLLKHTKQALLEQMFVNE